MTDPATAGTGEPDEGGGIVGLPRFEPLSRARALEVLVHGEMAILGRMPWSSNGTFLVTLTMEEDATHAIYKPHRGERPLWDFPAGLFRREVAAYELSEALGWGLVPETVLRAEAPLGIGSVQRFVEARFDEHYFTLIEDEAHHRPLQQIGVLDLVANNADRKSGHCLLATDRSRIWAIDNGLAFHVEPKLRTVIWEFAGAAIPEEWLSDLERVGEQGIPALAGLLDDDERRAVDRRALRVAQLGLMPDPGPDRPYPWPLV